MVFEYHVGRRSFSLKFNRLLESHLFTSIEFFHMGFQSLLYKRVPPFLLSSHFFVLVLSPAQKLKWTIVYTQLYIPQHPGLWRTKNKYMAEGLKIASSVRWVTPALAESFGAGGRRFILGAKENVYWKPVLVWAGYKIPTESPCLWAVFSTSVKRGFGPEAWVMVL